MKKIIATTLLAASLLAVSAPADAAVKDKGRVVASLKDKG